LTTIGYIFKIISLTGYLAFLKTIATAEEANTKILISELKITRKQYYSRLSNLMKAGLVQKKCGDGKYTCFSLSEMGRLVYNSLSIIECAFDNRLKLEIIDLIDEGNSDEARFSKEEFAKLVDTLIDNSEVREILLKPFSQ
jgi:hypothetical protein